MHLIKDILFFDNPENVNRFTIAFPWDTNPQAGGICRALFLSKEGNVTLGWCNPVCNLYLGKPITYVETDDSVSNLVALALYAYRTKGERYCLGESDFV